MMFIFWTKGLKRLRLIFYDNIPTSIKLKEDLNRNPHNDIKITERQHYSRVPSKKTTRFIGSSDDLLNNNTDKCNNKEVAEKSEIFQE